MPGCESLGILHLMLAGKSLLLMGIRHIVWDHPSYTLINFRHIVLYFSLGTGNINSEMKKAISRSIYRKSPDYIRLHSECFSIHTL
jgi:hypothetical protein